ncbi:FAD:protein FMN transferase [Lachnoclostridium sp.]|uniref:FAD:protein FMN transferase n=1 Tax=Lachnoclostridium sp. TaxID=2028282 RepID=UPI00289ED221|nr:FAD:protein FMN transferase [Lachnoclostridium sp.]
MRKYHTIKVIKQKKNKSDQNNKSSQNKIAFLGRRTVRCLTFITLSTVMLTFIACSKKSPSIDSSEPTPTVKLNEDTTPISKSSFKLNTVVSITLYDSQDESIIDEAFQLCDYYENLLSRTKKESEIYQLNEKAHNSYTVSDDTKELLTKGIHYSQLSNGAFDLTLEPLTSLWNFGSSEERLPSQDEIKEALTHIGYQYLTLDGNTITFEKDGMGIDLGAIAKGYIADKMKEFLISKGVNSAIINLGGNILCVGEKPDGSAFKVGIQKPFKDRNETIAVVEIRDLSVVSSGIYERFFTVDGKNYHHILNPATGYPYENDLTSVTIISKESVDGDALSTTCFALGLEKGMKLIESMPDTYAVFITSDYELHYTKGFKENIKIVE